MWGGVEEKIPLAQETSSLSGLFCAGGGDVATAFSVVTKKTPLKTRRGLLLASSSSGGGSKTRLNEKRGQLNKIVSDNSHSGCRT